MYYCKGSISNVQLLPRRVIKSSFLTQVPSDDWEIESVCLGIDLIILFIIPMAYMLQRYVSIIDRLNDRRTETVLPTSILERNRQRNKEVCL